MKRSAKEKNITKEAHIEAVWRSFGKTVLFAAISLQKKVTTAEGDLLIGHENFESLKKKDTWSVVGAIGSVLAQRSIKQKAYVLSDWFVSRRRLNDGSFT